MQGNNNNNNININNKNNDNGNLAVDFHKVALLVGCFQVELELKNYFFVEGRQLEDPEKNPWIKDKNQEQIQPTYDARPANRTQVTAAGGQ